MRQKYRVGHMATENDSVDLRALLRADKKTPRGGAAPALNLKKMIALFLIYILVVSNVITNNVIANFGGAVEGRHPTAYGTCLQGILLVLFYILVNHLVAGDFI